MPRGIERRRSRPAPRGAEVWRGFHRARHALWLSIVLLVGLGAFAHDRMQHSLGFRLLWAACALLLVAYPFAHLLAFRCPRCGGVFLATGQLRDFLGLGRILWGTRCGQCELPAVRPGEIGPPSSRPT